MYLTGWQRHWYYVPEYIFPDPELADISLKVKTKSIDADKVIRHLEELTSSVLKAAQFQDSLKEFRDGGFYQWQLSRYSLFEYNLYLQKDQELIGRKYIGRSLMRIRKATFL
jgi:hypothetical protein